MFEAAELGASVDRKTWDTQSPRLREQLLAAQEQQLAGSRKSLVVVLGGMQASGRREAANLLLEWMDARGIHAHALVDETDEERMRPRLYRFWRRLPPAGRAGIFIGSWYSEPIERRVFHHGGKSRFDRALDRIIDLERMLVAENVILVKLWMHIAKKVQRARLDELSSKKSSAWRVKSSDWKYLKHYDRFRAMAEHAVRRTSTAEAPWTVIEAEDEHYRSLAVARAVLTAIKTGTSGEPVRNLRRLPAPRTLPDLLGAVDLTKETPKEKYQRKLPKLQGRIAVAARKLEQAKRSLVLVFEGTDAAGKGGSIRRVSHALDAGLYDVNATSAPTDEEKAHPYLWRFWRTVPRLGRIGIYDRSWYGRVLVERVEGFALPEEWQRAYHEINSFEEQLVEGGAVLRKFWLAIGQDEQLKRFKSRQRTPYKEYKLTEDDWRNRAKWDAYAAAANEMFERTSTEIAPWTIIPANDKHYARLHVLKTVAEALEEAVS